MHEGGNLNMEQDLMNGPPELVVAPPQILRTAHMSIAFSFTESKKHFSKTVSRYNVPESLEITDPLDVSGIQDQHPQITTRSFRMDDQREVT
jgi:hypothetical protein